MMQSEKIAGDLRDAHDAVAGAHSPVPALAAAVRRLERRGAQAPTLVEPAVKSLDAALNALDEARGHLEHALRVADHDPQELERIEERLFALRAAGRKYNSPVDALNALAEKYAGDLALIDAGAERLAALEKAAKEAGARFAAEAAKRCRRRARRPRKSSTRRSTASSSRSSSNARNSPPQIESDAAAAGPNGIDRVEFWVQTNPGTRPGPLMKVASGGELARFLLALKVVLADRGSAPTLVFDEIDTGVGGAVADAIGVRLARLGDRVQVVTVTHAPQVAARAERHYLITKDALEKGKRVATRVTELAARAPPRGDRADAGRRRDHRGGARRRREAHSRGGRLEHDPEKCEPVFGKDHAQTKDKRHEISQTPLDVAIVGWHSHNQMFDEISADLQQGRAPHHPLRASRCLRRHARSAGRASTCCCAWRCFR